MNRKAREAEGPRRAAPRAPQGERIYAIGDIHGRDDLLQELQEMIQDDMREGDAERHTVVFLGDYVDRGTANYDVLEWLSQGGIPGAENIFLIGNHEAVMLQFLQDAEIGRDWVRFGGDTTLASYGVRIRRENPSIGELLGAQAELQARLPKTHEHFLKNLKLTYRAGDYLFVHAGIRPGVPLEQQDGNDLIWIRNRFIDSDADFGCVVVHGHTPNPEIQSRHNRIGIDTGAYFSGRLTAVVLENDIRRFLST
ncbi:MAG: metallophosphoesterase family protein [Minwuia sp.]|uniref:metallophosphoesterase family protein n=1 Tax=Minwuia sp. TaxID=2493630 RepID=UPI003A84E837